jgi:hypothetical protein
VLVASIIPFIPRGVFDDAATKVMGEAFEAACKSLHETGYAAAMYEIIARRIVEAARAGERDLKRLTDAALVELPKNKHD